MRSNPILSRFRFVALAEGVSWLVLLGAMYMKYAQGNSAATKYPGWAHGLLFVLYIVCAIPLFTKLKWSTDRVYGVMIAAILPFGTFVLERKWLR